MDISDANALDSNGEPETDIKELAHILGHGERYDLMERPSSTKDEISRALIEAVVNQRGMDKRKIKDYNSIIADVDAIVEILSAAGMLVKESTIRETIATDIIRFGTQVSINMKESGSEVPLMAAIVLEEAVRLARN